MTEKKTLAPGDGEDRIKNLVEMIKTQKVGAEDKKKIEVDPIDSKHVPHNSLGLFIQGKKKPIIIKENTVCILGRKQEIGDNIIDMTPYDALQNGVSRQHALLVFSGDRCVLRDLKSTNGTWVNNSQLSAHKDNGLNPGDSIRLGNLSIQVFFYQHLVSSDRTKISFKPKSSPFFSNSGHTTPQDFALHIAPLLHALENFQQFVSQLSESIPSPIHIRTITETPLEVEISGLQSVLELLTGKISTWQKAYLDDVLTYLQYKYIRKMERGETFVENEQFTDAHKRLERSVLKLSSDIVKSINPNQLEKDQAQRSADLLPILVDIVVNPYDFQVSSQ